MSSSPIQSVINESVGAVIANQVMSYVTNPNTMDYIFAINIDGRFHDGLEASIEIKLKLRVWKCEDGKFGMRTVWCPYVIETCRTHGNRCEYGNNANAQDETLDGGLHILQFNADDEEVNGSHFHIGIAIDTHGFDGTPFSWSLLRERCDYDYIVLKDATMRVAHASEPDATTPVKLPGQHD